MRALVVYESMFGNTHAVAEHIATALRPAYDTTVVAVTGASPELVSGADLVVVGGPTHAHGLSHASTRSSAQEMAEKDETLELDPDAAGPGLRDWFGGLPDGGGRSAAAFDTRVDAPAAFTGRASKGIAKRLTKHGFHLVADPESFLVDKHNHLLAGEAERAESWAASLLVDG